MNTIDIFCESPSVSIFNIFDIDTQQLIVKLSFDVLCQKTGDIQKALKFLQVAKQIQLINDYIIYTGELQLNNNVQELERIGVTTIPIIPLHKLSETKKSLMTLLTFPEYIRHPDNPSLNTKGEKDFIDDNSLKISINTFKTLPSNPQSETTLIKWSIDNINNDLLEHKQYKKNGGDYYIVKRHLNSLKYYKFPLYPKYTHNEKKMYKPMNIL